MSCVKVLFASTAVARRLCMRADAVQEYSTARDTLDNVAGAQCDDTNVGCTMLRLQPALKAFT